MIRELDAECARAMGLEIVHDDWPCGHAPDCGTYEAALRDDGDSGSWFNERGPVYKVCEPEEEWRSELGLWCEPVPAYFSDHAAARQLEDEIERRGLYERYIGWFYKHVCHDDMNSRQEVFAILRATPEQRARAFLEAIKEHTG